MNGRNIHGRPYMDFLALKFKFTISSISISFLNWKLKINPILPVYLTTKSVFFGFQFLIIEFYPIFKNPWVERDIRFFFSNEIEIWVFSFFVFIIKLKNEFQIPTLVFSKNWNMNFCSFFYEIFSVPKHTSDQSHHLNYP